MSAGVWWAAFTLVPLRWLREHPGAARPRPAATCSPTGSGSWATRCEGCEAYPLTLFFLLAYLIYNDGIQTVIALASQYGTEELRLGQSTLIVTILLVQFLAFGGALLLGALATRIGARKTVLLQPGAVDCWWSLGGVLAAGRAAAAVHAARRRRSAWCSAAARR